MQADFVAERRRRRLVLIFGLVLGIAAFVAIYFLLSRQNGNATAAPTPVPHTIVVAAVDIQSHVLIEEPMLTTVQVPDNPIWTGVATDPAEVVGNVALVNIAKGQAIEHSLYSGGNPQGVSILGPDETVAPDSPVWRAVSVLVPNERAVGGLVSPGDHIDLIVTLRPQLYDPTLGLVGLNDPAHAGPLFGQVYADPTTKITIQDVEVLQADPQNTIYVLKVTELEAEQIAHVQSSGDNEFTLTLRPVADTRPVDPTTYGQTTNEIITVYGFQIPVMINVAASASPGAFPSPTPIGSALPSGSPGASPSASPSAAPTP
jgi:Flp pilus assembly protein CpaB